jgi:hypothetical protein
MECPDWWFIILARHRASLEPRCLSTIFQGLRPVCCRTTGRWQLEKPIVEPSVDDLKKLAFVFFLTTCCIPDFLAATKP